MAANELGQAVAGARRAGKHGLVVKKLGYLEFREDVEVVTGKVAEVYADLHLFPGERGDWVLLLDATAQAYHLFDITPRTEYDPVRYLYQ